MSDVLEFLRFLLEINSNTISFLHITFATVVTIVVYFVILLIKKLLHKDVFKFNLTDMLVRCGVAFIIEYGLLWVYGPKIFILSIVVGLIASLYIRNKVFTFIDTTNAADHDLKLRMELSELRTKFKKNPYYSILEVLLYYGYISPIQKELVEAENIFKTPDEMAKEFLSKPILTEEQLNEAIGIMNVIRREGKILTREEALLLIMNLEGSLHKVAATQDSDEEKGGES